MLHFKLFLSTHITKMRLRCCGSFIALILSTLSAVYYNQSERNIDALHGDTDRDTHMPPLSYYSVVGTGPLTLSYTNKTESLSNAVIHVPMDHIAPLIPYRVETAIGTIFSALSSRIFIQRQIEGIRLYGYKFNPDSIIYKKFTRTTMKSGMIAALYVADEDLSTFSYTPFEILNMTLTDDDILHIQIEFKDLSLIHI